MKNARLIVVFIGLALCLVSITAAAQERVAILTEVSGDVKLARAGSDSFVDEAEFGTPLFAADRIRTRESASASVLYSNGDLLSIGENRSIEIENSQSDFADDSRRITRRYQGNRNARQERQCKEKSAWSIKTEDSGHFFHCRFFHMHP